MKSRRGTRCLYYDGYVYTPNQREKPGLIKRDYKCSMYHRTKCRARARTDARSNSIHTSSVHNHSPTNIYNNN